MREKRRKIMRIDKRLVYYSDGTWGRPPLRIVQTCKKCGYTGECPNEVSQGICTVCKK